MNNTLEIHGHAEGVDVKPDAMTGTKPVSKLATMSPEDRARYERAKAHGFGDQKAAKAGKERAAKARLALWPKLLDRLYFRLGPSARMVKVLETVFVCDTTKANLIQEEWYNYLPQKADVYNLCHFLGYSNRDVSMLLQNPDSLVGPPLGFNPEPDEPDEPEEPLLTLQPTAVQTRVELAKAANDIPESMRTNYFPSKMVGVRGTAYPSLGENEDWVRFGLQIRNNRRTLGINLPNLRRVAHYKRLPLVKGLAASVMSQVERGLYRPGYPLLELICNLFQLDLEEGKRVYGYDETNIPLSTERMQVPNCSATRRPRNPGMDAPPPQPFETVPTVLTGMTTNNATVTQGVFDASRRSVGDELLDFAIRVSDMVADYEERLAALQSRLAHLESERQALLMRLRPH